MKRTYSLYTALFVVLAITLGCATEKDTPKADNETQQQIVALEEKLAAAEKAIRIMREDYRNLQEEAAFMRERIIELEPPLILNPGCAPRRRD